METRLKQYPPQQSVSIDIIFKLAERNQLITKNMKEIVSQQFSLSIRDFLKGALVAVLSAIVPIVNAAILSYQTAEANFTMPWTTMGIVSLGAFVAYIAKNFLEPTKVIDLKPSEFKVEQVKNAQ